MAGGSGFRTSEERDWSNEDWVRLWRHETDSMGCDGMFATAISKHLSGGIGVGVGVGSRVNFSDDDPKAVSADSTLTITIEFAPRMAVMRLLAFDYSSPSSSTID